MRQLSKLNIEFHVTKTGSVIIEQKLILFTFLVGNSNFRSFKVNLNMNTNKLNEL